MGVPGGPADVRTRGSGRPIYDNSGNIVGLVISQLGKLKMVEVDQTPLFSPFLEFIF